MIDFADNGIFLEERCTSKGTDGYKYPDTKLIHYDRLKRLLPQCDVYSFGCVLFKLIYGYSYSNIFDDKILVSDFPPHDNPFEEDL